MEVRAPNAPSELVNNILSWLGICGGWYLPLALGVCLGPLPCHFCPLQQRAASRGAEGCGEGEALRGAQSLETRAVISMGCTGFQPTGLLDNLQKFCRMFPMACFQGEVP